MFKRRYQYQAKVQPASTSPETVTADRWVQPTNQPLKNWVSRAASYSVLLAAATAFFWNPSTPPQPPVQSVGAQQTLLRFKKKDYRAVYQQAEFFTPLTTIPVQVNGGQGSQQTLLRFKVNRRFYLQQSFFWSTFTPSSDVTSADKWQPVYPQPFPKKLYLTEAVDTSDGAIQGSPPIQEVITDAGSTTTSLRFEINRSFAAQYPSFFWNTSTSPETVTADKFVQPTNQPYLTKQYLQASNQQANFWAVPSTAETVTEDRWHQPVSQPYPKKLYLTEAIDSSDGGVLGQSPIPETAVDSGSSPSALRFELNKSYPATAPSFFWSTFTPVTAQIFDNWIPVYPDKVYVKSYLLTAQQQSLFWNTSTTPETVTEDKWHHTQSQPWPAKQYLLTANQQAFFWHISTQPEAVTADKFVQPTNQPYLTKQYLKTANQQASVWQISTASETITEDKWGPCLSQPWPGKSYLAAANQQSSFWSTFTPVTVQLADNWIPVYPDFVYAKRSLLASQQQAFFWNTSTQPETVSEDRWHQPVSEPYPYQKSLQTANQLYLSWQPNTPVPPPIVVSFNPVYPDKVYGKSYLLTAQQQAFFWNTSTQAENVSADRFVQPTSQPYPYTKLLRTGDQQSAVITIVPESVTADKFVQQTNQPVIPKVSLRTANQQATFWNTSTQQEHVTADRFAQPTNQPYLIKKYISAANQPYAWFVFAPEFISVDKFGQQTNQPYLTKKYIGTANQTASFWQPNTPPPEIITVDKWFQPTSEPYFARDIKRALLPWYSSNIFPLPNAALPFVLGTGTAISYTPTGAQITPVQQPSGSVAEVQQSSGLGQSEVQAGGGSAPTINAGGSVLEG